MVPTSTYRLQLHGAFRFDDALAILPYLHELGVSHVYCSPYLQAAPGSTHGYDVVDHSRVNEELGGEAAHQRFCRGLRQHHLGQILDIVPNHMAIGTRENRWWWDVLENGQSSRYAAFFDVEWNPPESKLRNTVLVPILGDHYGRVLEAGELKLAREDGKFTVRYYDHVLPASPRSIGAVVARAAASCGSEELGFIADTLSALPDSTETDHANITRRHRDKEIAARQLTQLCNGKPAVREAIEAELKYINADPDLLDDLLSRQNYRLAYWRTAGRELDYRRFFDINHLIGIRVEQDRVFRETHARVLEWLRTGVLDGVRIDHPDGLLNPEDYFERLQSAAPEAWVVAEKILEPNERLRSMWKVAGTTGYDFLYYATNVFVDPAAEQHLTEFYAEFTGESVDYGQVAHNSKHQVLRDTLAADITRLTVLFMEVCERHRRFRDFTRHDIHAAIREAIACFPVYRTYIRTDVGLIAGEDVGYIKEAISTAKTYRSDLPPDLFDFLQSVLLLQERGAAEDRFIMRFQQFTSPAMAKGVEDTTFYNYNRFTSLNEVGCDPAFFGITVGQFHEYCVYMQRHWPAAMLATSTHDTKRSEDVRARINLLSEIPQKWTSAVRRWTVINERYRRDGSPNRNMEYLLYQSMLGAWPIEHDRIANYMEKASREAKRHTSWTEPNAAYDKSLQAFVTAVYHDEAFRRDFEAFVLPLTKPGHVNALAQALLKFTAPGVPDIYQGAELWDGSLVDPDNRRPVNYELRRELLASLSNATAEQVLKRTGDGLPKLWLTQKALHLRRNHPEWFGKDAPYRPLIVEDDRAIAFLRGDSVAVIAPRFTLRPEGNSVVSLPVGEWHNVLTGETVDGGDVPLAELLRRFPVALLRK